MLSLKSLNDHNILSLQKMILYVHPCFPHYPHFMIFVIVFLHLPFLAIYSNFLIHISYSLQSRVLPHLKARNYLLSIHPQPK